MPEAPPPTRSTVAAQRAGIGSGLLGRFEVSDPRNLQQYLPILLAWIFWSALALALMVTHEPWRDELQAWGLVRASGTPFDVLANSRHEGHPPLWFFTLWPVAKIVGDVVAMQVVTFVLGSIATWLTLRHMPVRLWLRIAVVFGYFPLYEFGVMSRNYSLAYALVVVFLWLSHRKGTSAWIPALVAFGIASTAVNSLPLAIGLSFAVWGGPLFASRRRGPLDWKWIAPVLTFTALAAFVALPAVGGGRKVRLDALTPAGLWDALAAPSRALIPFSEFNNYVWGRPFVAGWPEIASALGILIVVGVAFALRHSRSALTIWLLTSILLPFIIVITVMPLGPRYVSPFFSALLAAVWFASADRVETPVSQRGVLSPVIALAAFALVALSVWAGLTAAWTDLRSPFSGGEAAAEWIEANSEPDRPIIILCAINKALCSSISIRLDAPAYTSATGQPFEFVDWTPSWKDQVPAYQAAAAARQLEAQTGAQVFIVSSTVGAPPGCASGHRTPSGTTNEYFIVCSSDQLASID